MKGMSVFATFAVTIAVLGLMIGLALRGSAQGFDPAAAASASSMAYLPVVGIIPGERVRVHVMNLSMDPTSPAVRFNVHFVNNQGTPLMPAVACDIRAGESCTVPFTSDSCPVGDDRCELRAVVSTDPVSGPPPGTDGGAIGGGGNWSSSMEIVDRQGRALAIVNTVSVMALPTQSGIGSDGGVVGTDGGVSAPIR